MRLMCQMRLPKMAGEGASKDAACADEALRNSQGFEGHSFERHENRRQRQAAWLNALVTPAFSGSAVAVVTC